MARPMKNILTAMLCLLQISLFCSLKVPFAFCTELASGVFERHEGRKNNISNKIQEISSLWQLLTSP